MYGSYRNANGSFAEKYEIKINVQGEKVYVESLQMNVHRAIELFTIDG